MPHPPETMFLCSQGLGGITYTLLTEGHSSQEAEIAVNIENQVL